MLWISQGKRFAVRMIVLALILFAAGYWFSITPGSRAKAYLTASRGWARNWPRVIRGAGVPYRLIPVLTSLGVLPGPVLFEVEPGLKMVLDPNDLVSQNILVDGTWESQSAAIIAEHVPDGGVFVDVGAHIGYYTLKGAMKAGPNGKVVSVEPNPLTLKVLRRNLQSNSFQNIILKEVAVSDRETTLDLYSVREVNTGMSSISKANAGKSESKLDVFKVPARPLDAILSEVGVTRVDVVKLDIEGAEALALRGAVGTLKRFRPVLLLEWDDPQLRQLGSSTNELAKYLNELGYREGRSFDGNKEWLPQ